MVRGAPGTWQVLRKVTLPLFPWEHHAGYWDVITLHPQRALIAPILLLENITTAMNLLDGELQRTLWGLFIMLHEARSHRERTQKSFPLLSPQTP